MPFVMLFIIFLINKFWIQKHIVELNVKALLKGKSYGFSKLNSYTLQGFSKLNSNTLLSTSWHLNIYIYIYISKLFFKLNSYTVHNFFSSSTNGLYAYKFPLHIYNGLMTYIFNCISWAHGPPSLLPPQDLGPIIKGN